jgi:hopene-associated glycosyltransferase HpnB
VLAVLLLGGSALALLAWLAVLLLPWQPHRTRERLEADGGDGAADLAEVCVLIPARDEAATIGRVLAALKQQGKGLEVVVIDDQSSDGTADICARAVAIAPGAAIGLRVLRGEALPAGWAGKLWALEQGFCTVQRPFVLLLDADIELAPATLPVLLRAAQEHDRALVSVMAELHCATLWERLLAPPFVFFFKLLYPFALANDPERRTAGAAGGCMLARTDALRAIGGFGAIRGALIDDCTLAARLKAQGRAIWLGMSHSVRSLRVYASLGAFWQMVSRSAFTQLRYSASWLLVATLLLLLVLLLPPVVTVLALAAPSLRSAALLGALAWLAAAAAYWPVARFYRLPALWALALPAAAALFLAMTWSSALNYWRGTRATWKNRSYGSIRS